MHEGAMQAIKAARINLFIVIGLVIANSYQPTAISIQLTLLLAKYFSRRNLSSS